MVNDSGSEIQGKIGSRLAWIHSTIFVNSFQKSTATAENQLASWIFYWPNLQSSVSLHPLIKYNSSFFLWVSANWKQKIFIINCWVSWKSKYQRCRFSHKFCSSCFYNVKDSPRTLPQRLFKQQTYVNPQWMKQSGARGSFPGRKQTLNNMFMNLKKISQWEVVETTIITL